MINMVTLHVTFTDHELHQDTADQTGHAAVRHHADAAVISTNHQLQGAAEASGPLRGLALHDSDVARQSQGSDGRADPGWGFRHHQRLGQAASFATRPHDGEASRFSLQ